jgi:hypothetical protein
MEILPVVCKRIQILLQHLHLQIMQQDQIVVFRCNKHACNKNLAGMWDHIAALHLQEYTSNYSPTHIRVVASISDCSMHVLPLMFRIQGQDFSNLFDLRTCRSSIRRQQGEGSKGGLMKEKLLVSV